MNPLYLILPEGKPDQGYCGQICHWDKTTCHSGCVDDKQCKEFKRKRKTSCRVVVFVGVVLPKGGYSGTHFFDLCQGEDCVKAGDIPVYGTTDPKDKYVTLQGGVNDDDFYLAAGRTGRWTDLSLLLTCCRLLVLRPGQHVLDGLLVILQLVPLHLVQLEV